MTSTIAKGMPIDLDRLVGSRLLVQAAMVELEKAAAAAREPIEVDVAPAPRRPALVASRPQTRSRNDKSPASPAEFRSASGEARMLAVLAQHYPSPLREAPWATVAGLKRTGGTWATYLSRLRTRGHVEKTGDGYLATQAGLGAAGVVPAMPQTRDEALAMWRGKPGMGAAMKLVDAVVEVGPMERDALAEATGLAGGGGTFSTYLSRCRTTGLLEVDGSVVSLGPALEGLG